MSLSYSVARRRAQRCCAAVAALLSLIAPTVALADDGTVQPPALSAPQRGSLAGQYGGTAFGAAEVSRGGFNLPSPMVAPGDRGALLAQVFPHYSPDHGLSEWGLGWSVSLGLTRWRVSGDLDWATDDMTGPWGHIVRGTDGYWYPDGLQERVRLQAVSADTWIGRSVDGTIYTFGGADRVLGANGKVYAWPLTQVETVTGAKMIIQYETNASGRPFPKLISYGGRGDDFQYQIELGYETTSLLFVSYAPGKEYTLDRRVRTVVMRAKDASRGTWAERWHYLIHYVEEGLGPSFYVSQIDQVFASGEAAPPVRYRYALQKDRLPALGMRPVPKLATVLQQFGNDEVQGIGSTVLDVDHDGRPDLEDRVAGTLLLQKDSGFEVQPLAPAPPGAYDGCRPPDSELNRPRELAQLRADDDSFQVVKTEYGGSVSDTTMYVCNRLGEPLDAIELDGHWILGKNVRLVDVDRDRQPDLVSIDYGQYAIRPNTSSAVAYSFGGAVGGMLFPAFVPHESWVQDFNGDGLVDLVARDSASIVVWYGKGNLQFVEEGQIFQLFDASSLPVTDLQNYRIGFLDVNKDGLTDVLLSSYAGSLLFVNNGYDLNLTELPGLEAVWTPDMSAPVTVDLAGSGNSELLVTDVDGAYSMALDAPEVGLMTSADDGRGTVLTFHYQRAPAVPGVRQRVALLTELSVASTGYDAVSYGYQYESPQLHSVGKYLVGFEQVTRTSPTTIERDQFVADDHDAGMPRGTELFDKLTPEVVAFTTRKYRAAHFAGVPWLQPAEEHKGYSTADGRTKLEERTEFVSYEADFCPTETRVLKETGTLTTKATRATVPKLSLSLHCLVDSLTATARHADARWNFVEQRHFVRNELGLPTMVETLSPTESVTLQTITYNDDGTIAAVAVPGRGATSFGYDAKTRLLRSLTSNDGVVTSAVYDPVTDGILTMITQRGASAYAQQFRFDGQERLQKSWDDLGRASEANPQVLLAYRYATSTQPGAIRTTTLVDAPSASSTRTIDLQTATGEALVSARAVPEGWSFGGLTQVRRATDETLKWVRASAGKNVDVAAFDMPALLASTSLVADSITASSGTVVASTTQFHADVQRRETGTLALAGQLVETSVENGRYRATHTFDADHRQTSFTDEEGATWGYRYDLAGRLRAIELPDGTEHRAFYDEHGRLTRVERDGIASQAFAYYPGTQLMRSSTFIGSDGAAVREASWSYDAVGRKQVETHTDLANGHSQSYRFYYDGATPMQPQLVTTRGFVTGVSGDGFSKVLSYRADGKLAQRSLTLGDWRTITSVFDYSDSGAVRSTTTEVKSGGTTLERVTLANRFDPYGRISAMELDGKPAVSIGYDENNQVSWASFADGSSARLQRDPLTRRMTGMSQVGAGWTADDRFRYDERGLVGSEGLSVGRQSLAREYGYSPARFLSGTKDKTLVYSYDPSGLPTLIGEDGVDRAIQRGAHSLDVAGVHYRLDNLGRVTSKGNLELAYGPNGQVATAAHDNLEWEYIYDENGQRILKMAGGVAVSAYPEEGYLDEAGLVQPIRFQGVAIGIVRGGALIQLPTDIRGTVTGDSDGSARFATPFGNRAVHPALAAAIDYVNKGWDADLRIVRMGVRDYDPALSQFLSPDPLLLASLQECAQRPLECNLYSYVANNPLQYIDPEGMQMKPSNAEELQQYGPIKAQLYEIGNREAEKEASFTGRVWIVVAVTVHLVPLVVERLIISTKNSFEVAESMQARGVTMTCNEAGQCLHRDVLYGEAAMGVMAVGSLGRAAVGGSPPAGALLEESSKPALPFSMRVQIQQANNHLASESIESAKPITAVQVERAMMATVQKLPAGQHPLIGPAHGAAAQLSKALRQMVKGGGTAQGGNVLRKMINKAVRFDIENSRGHNLKSVK